MVIDIIKQNSFFKPLEEHNKKILDFASNLNYNEHGQEYDFSVNRVSRWFDPKNVRDLGLSRTYPHMDPCQYRPEYNLILHCSNYLSLFVMEKLYHDRKDVLFEDIGAGLGWLYIYLNALGFTNFHTIDDFSQITEVGCKLFSDINNLNAKFNQVELKPIISNNVCCPLCPFREMGMSIKDNNFFKKNIIDTVHQELELIINASNPQMVKFMNNNCDRFGFKFLCKDTDDLAEVYCRVDKYEQFKERLVQYESK